MDHKKLIGLCCWIIVFGSAFFVITRIKERTIELEIKATALQKLIVNETIHGRTLCFIALPKSPFASGLAQHLRMLGFNQNNQIFYDPSTFTVSCSQTINSDLCISNIQDGFRLSTRNKQRLSWGTFGGEIMRLGTKTIHDSDDRKVYEMTYSFENIMHYDPLFISWDYEQNQCNIIHQSKQKITGSLQK